MKQPKFIYKRIKIKLYRTSITLFEYNQVNCDIIGAPYETNISGYTSTLTNGGVCIGIKKNTTISEIAHECLHATNKILNKIGNKNVDVNNDEVQAYLLTYIMEEILKVKNNIFKKGK